ncbi:MAG: hypothetical protein CBC35_08945 [Planctomycetes bacterium TMED75]|nr:hypothetical protein [Planctomycetaceae bacterium]OUU91699.1 MAG: hypothetical protein CBC35_08945 [Planctomycetes bacterium TMED75]
MRFSGYKSDRPTTRPTAVGVVGVIGIIVFSVGLGVLGPQIVRRSSMEVGLPLSTVLDKVHVFYQTEEFLRFRRSGTQDPVDTQKVDEQAIRSALDSMFGGDAGFIPLDSARLPPVAIQEDVTIDLFDQPGLAVIYQEQLPARARFRPANVMCLYMPFGDHLRELYARNEFGVPELLSQGELVLRCINQQGVQTWILFWYEQNVMHFLLAPSEEMIDFVIDKTGLPEPVEASFSTA